MIRVTFDEIEQYRAELDNDPVALKALEMIEDCEGDLEDAAISLALQVGQEPDRSEQWLDGLAKRWRVFLCQTSIKEAVQAGRIATPVKQLASEDLPGVLALPIVLYALKLGIESFCQPLEEKR
ncbi:hypothetical protein [Egbenema bharatensis]|uniref:hypothetical protein n=1 Tax=Egbenema bharatensis TaxID=3463334 RepID=UPI003A8863CE